MAERHCPACSAERASALGLKNDLQVSACGGCGTLYARYAAGAVAGQDYNSYYHEANLSTPDFVDRRLDEIISGLAPFRRTNRLLDIGCGAGTLLKAARRAGWEAEGMEVSLTAVEHVRGEGFKVFRGELAEAQYPDGYFDVVTASEILEHVPEPQEMLEEVARILRPGGLFWGTTPHGRGLSARLLGLGWSIVSPPEHLQLFSLEGVRRMLRAAGFRRARVTSRGVNPFEIVHALRRGGEAGAVNGVESAGVSDEGGRAGFGRVESSYQLNELFTRNFATRWVKAGVNGTLRVLRLGDSINIWAEK